MDLKLVKIQDLQPGDIILSRSTNIMAKMIRWADDSDVSHAGLYIGNNQVAEALIVGNSGLNINPLSFDGTEWVMARRLRDRQPYGPIEVIANSYLAQGNRYGFEQLFLLALILLTRKVNFELNPMLRRIAVGVMDKANEFVNQLLDEGREPMICSEFVFRTYDEAMDDENDPYSLEILSQTTKLAQRRFSRQRRRRRLFGAAPESNVPTVHPESLLATTDLGRRSYEARGVGSAVSDVSDAELDMLMREFLNEPPMMGAAEPVLEAASAETDMNDVKDAAADFAMSLGNAYSMKDSRGEPIFGAGEYEAASPDEKLRAVVADFVTPGDLHRSPSLVTVGLIEG
jgi:hypothetical protein